MLKSLPAEVYKFKKLKCGEIYCVKPTVYEVVCCLCGVKVQFDKFREHFLEVHLNQTMAMVPLPTNTNDCDEDPIKCEENKSEDPVEYKLKKFMKVPTYSTKTLELITKNDKKENAEDEKTADNEDADNSDSNSISSKEDNKDYKAKKESLRFPCNLCSRTYKSKRSLANHRRFCHDPSRIPKSKKAADNECTEKDCQNKAVDNSDSHSISSKEDDKDSKSFSCSQCSRIFESNRSLANHRRFCQPLRTSKPKKAADNEGAEQDCQIEDVDNSDSHSVSSKEDDNDSKSKKESLPFPCSLCSRNYKSKRSLAHHRRTCHDRPRTPKTPDYPHKCKECGRSFRTERILECHMYKHTGIFCDICGKPFTQIGTMVRHRIRHTGVKSHKCKECDNCFYTTKELRSHMLRHTGVWPHMCEICGRRCRDHGVLMQHMRRHTGERPAKCGECGKSFYCNHDLKVHSVTHSTERPFKCVVCGSTFALKKSLRVHKKVHSTERNHVCKICGKGFVQSTGLTAHMRTHDAAFEANVDMLRAV